MLAVSIFVGIIGGLAACAWFRYLEFEARAKLWPWVRRLALAAAVLFAVGIVA